MGRRRLVGQTLIACRGVGVALRGVGGAARHVGGASRRVGRTRRARASARQHGGVREGGVGAPAQGVARDAPPRRLPRTLPPLTPGPPAPLRGPVKAGLRAEARGLAGLQEGGGGAGLPPATAHALPPAQLPGEREREGDMKKTQADEEGQHWKENIDGESGWTTLKICWTSNADSILT